MTHNYSLLSRRLTTLLVTISLLVGLQGHSSAQTYLVRVAGIDVTNENKEDVLGNGTVKYNPETKTLTLKNANITGSEGEAAIYCNDDRLTLQIEGTCTLNQNENALDVVRFMHVDAKITGPGKLIINAQKDGIECISELSKKDKACRLTLEDCNIEINSKLQGVVNSYDNANNAQLIFRRANVTVNTTVEPLYGFFSGVTFDGCKIKTPEGASYQYGAIWLNDDYYTGTLEIVAEDNDQPVIPTMYMIQIGGKSISSENQNDVLGDGTVKYDPTTKTLTLKDANITCTQGMNPILVFEPTINIELEGTNTVTQAYDDKPAIHLWHVTTKISGSGKLIINSQHAGIENIYNSASEHPSALTIEECNLEIKSVKQGLMASSMMPEENPASTLIVRNANVVIKTSDTPIKGFTSGVTLDNCHIKSPEGGQFVDGAVQVNGQAYKGNLEIAQGKDIAVESLKSPQCIIIGMKGALRIESSESYVSKILKIYSLDGQQIMETILYTQPTDIPLPAGSYIVQIGEDNYKAVVL